MNDTDYESEVEENKDTGHTPYGEATYWDDRYEKAGGEAAFDWLETFESLEPYMRKFMPRKNIRILVLGCGNAEFSEDLYDAGYENIVNIDISPVCIQQMTVRNAIQRPNMSWKVGDVTNMEFKNSSFDLAIDKSTIDALLCGDDAYIMVGKMMKECQRVLKKGGHYFAISFGNPEARAHHFQSPFLSVTNFQYTIKEEGSTDDKAHFVYVWKKKADADRVSAANFDSWLRKEQGEDSEEEK